MAKQPMDYLRSRKQKVSRDVWVPYDSNDADEIQRLEGELADAQERTRDNPRDTDAQDKVAALKAELEDLREELKPNCAHFVVRSLGRKEYDDLQDAYPPTKEQVSDGKKQGVGVPAFNPDTFPPAILGASLALVVEEAGEDGAGQVEVPFTEEQAIELWNSEEWNQAEIMGLFTVCLEVNNQRRVMNLGNASR
jgi:hypothetical protein